MATSQFLYVPPEVGDEIEEENEKSEKGRKRKRDEDNWRRSMSKGLA